MGVDRERVEKEIGLGVSRDMRRLSDARREDKPPGIDAGRVAAARRLRSATALSPSSHSTLPDTAASSRIQIAKTSGLIL